MYDIERSLLKGYNENMHIIKHFYWMDKKTENDKRRECKGHEREKRKEKQFPKL